MKKILAALLITMAISFNAYAAINLNTASRAELESIKGIGPSKAQAIIDYRKKHGDFNSISELKEINGIGPETLKNMRRKLTVEGQSQTTRSNKSKKKNDQKTAKKPKRIKKQYDIKITTHQP